MARAADFTKAHAQIVEQISDRKFDRATWGIHVVDLASGETIFETNATKLLKPASVAKLFTGAAALLELGIDYRIRTSIHGKLTARGRVDGPLTLYGRGDPSLHSRFLQPERDALGELVRQLRERGVKSVPKGVIADTTFFESIPYGGGWTWDDTQYWYGARVSAISIYDNFAVWRFSPGTTVGDRAAAEALAPRFLFVLQNQTSTGPEGSTANLQYMQDAMPDGQTRLTVWGSVPRAGGIVEERAPVPNPARWAAEMLRERLASNGVRMKGDITVKSRPPGVAATEPHSLELAFVESPPLANLLQPLFWMSDNLYAQALLLHLATRNADDGSSETRGAREVVKAIERFGISAADLQLEDGAGLSRACLLTPQSVTQLLSAIQKSSVGETFVAALPVAGRDGRIATRLKDTEGRIRAKSGSVQFVSTLAGYATNTEGRELAFAIFLNNYSGPASEARSEVDALARLLIR